MCHKYLAPLANHHGIALITAIFAIVILALFGLLITRYTVTTQTSSAEDYLWAQSLYSAESVMRLNILSRDNGGNLGGSLVKPHDVQGFDFTDPLPPEPARVSDDFTGAHKPAKITVQAKHGTGVSRTVEAHYIL
ncbi:MAG: hypothetical protein ACD_75C00153G0005 [uncultured bacterium]|nr:MAG: hypothetical protein ACD_75C00153G0005 [uncultured bacterium]